MHQVSMLQMRGQNNVRVPECEKCIKLGALGALGGGIARQGGAWPLVQLKAMGLGCDL